MDISQKKTILFAATGTICCLFVIYCFSPGYMSPDSTMFMYQAQTGNYSNWQPPMYAYTWSVLRHISIFAEPLVMLIFQNLIFWGGITLLVFCLSGNNMKHAFLIPAAGFYPAILCQLSTLWKDVLLGSVLVASIAFLKYAENKKHRLFLWASLLGLLYSVFLRHNSLLAVLPIFIWWSVVFIQLNKLTLSKPNICIVTFVTTLVTLAGSYYVNSVNVAEEHPVQQIYMYDLVGLSSRNNQNYLPEGLAYHFSVSDMKAVYSKYGGHEIYFADFDPKQLPVPPGKKYIPKNPNKDQKRFPQVKKKEYVDQLRDSWIGAILANGSTYLRHRMTLFSVLLGLQDEAVCYPFHDRIDQNRLFEYDEWSQLNRHVMSVLYYLKNSLIFRGWVYLAALCALLFWYIKRRRLAEICIAAGAVWYILAYFFVAATCDFRFLYWPVIAAVILLLLLFEEKQHSEGRNII